MSVVLNFNYLVIRKSALEESYPGGLAAFRKDWMPNAPKDEEEDAHLVSFCSMGGGLAQLRDRLVECGLLESPGESNETVFQETIVRGEGSGCDWLEFDEEDGFLVCWLKGHDRGKLTYAYLR